MKTHCSPPKRIQHGQREVLRMRDLWPLLPSSSRVGAATHPWAVSAQLPVSSGHTWPPSLVNRQPDAWLLSPPPPSMLSKLKWHWEVVCACWGWGWREEWRADRYQLSSAVKIMLTISCAPQVRFRTNTAAFCLRGPALNEVFDEQPSICHRGIWPAGRIQGLLLQALGWERIAWMSAGWGSYRREWFGFPTKL